MLPSTTITITTAAAATNTSTHPHACVGMTQLNSLAFMTSA